MTWVSYRQPRLSSSSFSSSSSSAHQPTILTCSISASMTLPLSFRAEIPLALSTLWQSVVQLLSVVNPMTVCCDTDLGNQILLGSQHPSRPNLDMYCCTDWKVCCCPLVSKQEGRQFSLESQDFGSNLPLFRKSKLSLTTSKARLMNRLRHQAKESA
jgi:hypothetical protein